ncbi:hypothetical protein [Mesorhizobium sp. 1B3]|uniref:hypothetical protein n=1 Tax=Mesorhizobium sp. 1B3 TaxID=3243599 RepID=UPI003D998780
MTEQTSAELEREAERARARVADTAETIKSKLTAGQLLDEFTNMFSGNDGSRALVNLKNQIRDNPLPVALVSAGLAWLAFGRERSDWVAAGMSEERSDGATGTIRSMASSAKGAASAVGGHVSEAGSTAADAAGRIASTSADYAERVAGRSSDYLHQVRSSASDLVDREPLILAGLGLAIGTAIGAMLPASRFEQEEFGEQADRLRKGAEDFVKEAADEARDVATKAYDAVNEEADRQGLLSDDGSSVVDRVGEVVKSAAGATEEAVRDKLGSGKPGTAER